MTRSGNVFRQFFDGSLYLQRTTSTPAYQTVSYRPPMIAKVSDVPTHTSNNGLDIIDVDSMVLTGPVLLLFHHLLYILGFTPGDLNSQDNI